MHYLALPGLPEQPSSEPSETETTECRFLDIKCNESEDNDKDFECCMPLNMTMDREGTLL